MIEDHKHFLKMIEKLKLYFVKFDKIGQIILKIYFSNYKVRKDKCWPVIIIIYNKHIFLSNDNLQFNW